MQWSFYPIKHLQLAIHDSVLPLVVNLHSAHVRMINSSFPLCLSIDGAARLSRIIDLLGLSHFLLHLGSPPFTMHVAVDLP